MSQATPWPETEKGQVYLGTTHYMYEESGRHFAGKGWQNRPDAAEGRVGFIV